MSAEMTRAAVPAPEAPIAVAPAVKPSRRRWVKPTAFLICLTPLAWLAVLTFTNRLGPNPVEAIIRYLGDWALRFLLIALAVTPVRLLTGWQRVGRLRRMLGLFAFSYVLLHVASYVGIDQQFDMAAVWKDVQKRVYITVGMAALLALLPLAVTSTDKMVRRLGGARWRRLHRLVYPAGVAGVIHYFLMIKAGFVQPLIYGLILATLFALRFYKRA
jgi:sulfoxide reductase heme-binding subunit YedZ